eukprot:1848915-Lingulodinium_polyedra.AAC.1
MGHDDAHETYVMECRINVKTIMHNGIRLRCCFSVAWMLLKCCVGTAWVALRNACVVLGCCLGVAW